MLHICSSTNHKGVFVSVGIGDCEMQAFTSCWTEAILKIPNDAARALIFNETNTDKEKLCD